MYYTENRHKDYSALGNTLSFGSARLSERETESCAVGTLTNYKRDVDINEYEVLKERHKIVHYGLSKNNLENVTQKLKKQKQFLEYSFIYDRIMRNKIPLSDIFISANHSPNRYYAEIQNRVNTLSVIAKERNLKALFMTITLPSELYCPKLSRQLFQKSNSLKICYSMQHLH